VASTGWSVTPLTPPTRCAESSERSPPRSSTVPACSPLLANSPPKLYEEHYRLMLWCEHPDQLHPWPAATYHLHQPKDWLVRVSPYANLVLKTLQLVVPVATAVAGVTLTEDQLKHAKPELELMKTLVGKLPNKLAVENPELESPEPHSRLTAAEGEALRGMRSLLFQQDPMRSFGDLRRVSAPSGDFLWVCTDHRPEYDPGLPSIPGSELRD
jgi:internalin A